MKRPLSSLMLRIRDEFSSAARKNARKLKGLYLFFRSDVEVSGCAKIEFPADIILGGGNKFLSNVKIQSSGFGSIEIGKGTIVCAHTTIEAAGGRVKIGDDIVVGEYSTIQGQGGVVLEDRVLLASHVHILSNHHEFSDVSTPIKYQPNTSKGVRICEGAWIGIECVILSGVTIGCNSVVGSGSIVKEDVPDYAVVVGRPAKIIKLYDHEMQKWISVK